MHMKSQAADNGWVTHLQRFSLHDGPGVRTTVFLQGCNLSCRWCHNPETISVTPVLLHYRHRCVGCGTCIKGCPNGALMMDDGVALLNRDRCTACLACTALCPSRALISSSQCMSVNEVVRIVLKDHAFYQNSGGGVTISGGEPMLQFPFVATLLPALRQTGLHVALDTAGLQPWEKYAALLSDVDLFLVDYKIFDATLHRAWTGAANQTIRENIVRLSHAARAMWIRIPIIPGVNDDDTQIQNIAHDLAEMAFSGQVEPLAFHGLGQGKYDASGQIYPFADTKTPTAECMEQIRDIFAREGLHVRS